MAGRRYRRNSRPVGYIFWAYSDWGETSFTEHHYSGDPVEEIMDILRYGRVDWLKKHAPIAVWRYKSTPDHPTKVNLLRAHLKSNLHMSPEEWAATVRAEWLEFEADAVDEERVRLLREMGLMKRNGRRR